MSEETFPYLEIDMTDGGVQLTLVINEHDRRLVAKTEAGHVVNTLAKGKSMLPQITAESDDYADDKNIQFDATEEPTEIILDHLLAQLQQKINAREVFGLDAVEKDSEIYNTLIANWQSDLYLSFRRAIHLDILKSALEYTQRSQQIENFVLIPGDLADEFIDWLAADIDTLGYDLRVKIA